MRDIFHLGVESLEDPVVWPELLLHIGRFQPAEDGGVARAPGLPGQRAPVDGVHLGKIQALALPADGTAVVTHKDDVVPQGREHLL